MKVSRFSDLTNMLKIISKMRTAAKINIFLYLDFSRSLVGSLNMKQ